MEEELRKGFITIPGGHRIGLAGRTVLSGGGVEHLRDITGFNVRIAREVPGIADGVLPYLLDKGRQRMMHTLILSPPQHGKTTLLRDLARQISLGELGKREGIRPGLKVGIVDERSEIAGSRRGVPAFDVGPRTDVLDGCPKAEGMMMMIRSLSPDVLIADEIGRPEDAEAVTEPACRNICHCFRSRKRCNRVGSYTGSWRTAGTKDVREICHTPSFRSRYHVSYSGW